MARGSYIVSIDAKGRMSIPTKLRDGLQRVSDGQLVVTVSPTGECLWLYTLLAWEAVERKLVSLPTLNQQARKLRRMLIGHADDCDMDGSGRILVPAHLREYAQISKKAVLVGQGDKYEIWDEAHWEAHRNEMLTVEMDESSLPAELETMSF